jgi:hypothetical protein
MSTDGTAVHVTSGTVEVANNILLFHVTGIGVDAGAVSEDYNLFYGTGLDTKVVGPVTSGGHSWSEDPELVDLSGGDYHILASSPAKDAAPCVGTRFDFDGDPRPVTAGCDIGADEYQVKVYLPLILR